ncbi:hypothetical protein Q763_04980 [Flavobacterium beibuense F44-8]|uniref:HmuY protein n=1 Tax=Flavobacterium beibuense F44-8 TaxID=1406840 RepID=A0A0A2LTR1_9FLAO|nr:HmuY family protein [Flavobacterium beibuense]KGO83369.1 hypothetical protein Q763_04980 [Flavobacterium beibuense F44-8]
MKKSILILAAVGLLASCSSDDSDNNNNGGVIDPGTNPIEETAYIQPEIGGPNEPNQVYIGLNGPQSAVVERTAWDLGFYSGSDFRVILNGSLKMAAKKLETTNIDEVQEPNASVTVSFATLASLGYVDNPTGILTGDGNGEGTAIAEVSATDSENFVYLVNMGYGLSTTEPAIGSVNVDGDQRGWMKIRVLRNGDNYVLQYAPIDATTHQEVTISKNDEYNFTFFSMVNNNEVMVEPKKGEWDINFTTFTNYYPYQGVDVLYPFADYAVLNILGGTRAYEVVTEEADGGEAAYNAFTFADVDYGLFEASAEDHRFVSWRTEAGPNTTMTVQTDRFFVVKDASGNLFKLLFRALKNDAGERGYPVFEYEQLQ